MTNSVPESQPSQPGGFSHAAYPHIDKYLTIDGLLKSHAAEEEQSPAICYPAHGVADYEEHTAADIDRYVNVAARFYIQQGLEPAVRVTTKRQTRTILMSLLEPFRRESPCHRSSYSIEL